MNFENYFELLGVSESIEIDQEALHQNYVKLQQLFHPDKILANTKFERILAAEYSAKLNKAYNTLLDDKKRAEYLLYLKGIIINQEENNNVKLNSEMLNEILEINENPKGYDLEGIKINCWNSFKKLYENQQFEEAAQAIIKLQFLSKIA